MPKRSILRKESAATKTCGLNLVTKWILSFEFLFYWLITLQLTELGFEF